MDLIFKWEKWSASETKKQKTNKKKERENRQMESENKRFRNKFNQGSTRFVH